MADKCIKFIFYQTPSGVEPVREWLIALDAIDLKIIGTDLSIIEYGYPIGMPVCRNMGHGLFECRSNLPQGKKARIIFCIDGDKMIALNGFIKKTQRTPKQEIDLALRRKKEMGL